MNRKNAFTLTEVIIVLVILGALALILIPNLANMMPDEHNIKYKKDFYTIQEIISDIANDPSVCQGMNNNGAGVWTVPPTEARRDRVLTMCYDDANTPRNLDVLICERLNTVAGVNCNDPGNLHNIVTTDGSHWNISRTAGRGDNPNMGDTANNLWNAHIFVDVDGGNSADDTNNLTGGNVSANTGTYRITIRSDGKIFPGTPADGELEDGLLLNNPSD